MSRRGRCGTFTHHQGQRSKSGHFILHTNRPCTIMKLPSLEVANQKSREPEPRTCSPRIQQHSCGYVTDFALVSPVVRCIGRNTARLFGD
jgi:hypothetical protein